MFILIIGLIAAQSDVRGVVLPCENILDAKYCIGPAFGRPGYVCSWSENECEAVSVGGENKGEMEGAETEGFECGSLSEMLCRQNPTCSWNKDECEELENEETGEENEGKMPMLPGSSSPHGIPSNKNNHHPLPAGDNGNNPGVLPPQRPSSNVPPMYPSGGYMPGPMYPWMNPGAQFPVARQCKTIESQFGCYGPAAQPGKICTWDPEEEECSEAPQPYVRAICEKFARDAMQCNSHENCFWNTRSKECVELKMVPSAGMRPATGPIPRPGPGRMPPSMGMEQDCSNFRTLIDCAGQASCFWEPTGMRRGFGICIDVLHAENVCFVLNSPQLCSTNSICAWRGMMCLLSNQQGGFLRSVRNEETPRSEEPNERPPSFLLYYVLAAVGGLALGFVLAGALRKMNRMRTGNPSYHDLILDVKSQTQRVV